MKIEFTTDAGQHFEFYPAGTNGEWYEACDSRTSYGTLADVMDFIERNIRSDVLI